MPPPAVLGCRSVSRAASRSIGRKTRKKKTESIANPLAARVCVKELLVSVIYGACMLCVPYHDTVVPGKYC